MFKMTLLIVCFYLCLGVGGLEGHLGLGILQRLKWTKWLAEKVKSALIFCGKVKENIFDQVQ